MKKMFEWILIKSLFFFTIDRETLVNERYHVPNILTDIIDIKGLTIDKIRDLGP